MQFSEQECKYITQLQRGASAATGGKGNWASERDTGKGYAILQSIESFRVEWTLWSVPYYYPTKQEEEEHKCNNNQDLVWKF